MVTFTHYISRSFLILIPFSLIFGLQGCASVGEAMQAMDNFESSIYRNTCANYGYGVGTQEYANCVQSESLAARQQAQGTYTAGRVSQHASSYGGSEAIQQCMDNMIYRMEVKKPFSGWTCVRNDVNCKTVRVRTEISQNAAALACQGHR